MAEEKFDSKSFNPQAFGAYTERIPNLKKNELIKSRALKGNQDIKNTFSSQTGTVYAVLPMHGLIGGAAQNYDGETDLKSESTDTFERGVVVVGRMKGWTERDFSEDVTGGVSFMDNVAAQVNDYKADLDQTTLVKILEGVFAMTGKENKVFVDTHTSDITAVTATDKDGNVKNVVQADTLNTALQKAAGDNKSKFTIAIMHSAVATNLENLKLLKYMTQTDANGVERDLTLATWNGRLVLIDDSMPTEEVAAVEESGTKGESGYVAAKEAYTKYTTYVLGDGAFDYEDIGAKVPYEMYRDPKTHGGEDTLYMRQRKVFAPYGISFTRKSMAAKSPTDTELADGSNWTLVDNGKTNSDKKVIDHKAIPIARIISRG